MALALPRSAHSEDRPQTRATASQSSLVHSPSPKITPGRSHSDDNNRMHAYRRRSCSTSTGAWSDDDELVSINSGGALEKFESSFVFEAEASTPGGLPLRRSPRKLKRPANPVARALLRVDDDDDDDRSFAPIEDPAPDALTKKRKSAATPARKPSRRVKEKAVPPAPLSNQIADLAIDDDRPLALRRPPRLSALPAPPSPTNALGV